MDAVDLPDQRGNHGIQFVHIATAVVIADGIIGCQTTTSDTVLVVRAVEVYLRGNVFRPLGGLYPIQAVLGYDVKLVTYVKVGGATLEGYFQFLHQHRIRIAIAVFVRDVKV